MNERTNKTAIRLLAAMLCAAFVMQAWGLPLHLVSGCRTARHLDDGHAHVEPHSHAGHVHASSRHGHGHGHGEHTHHGEAPSAAADAHGAHDAHVAPERSDHDDRVPDLAASNNAPAVFALPPTPRVELRAPAVLGVRILESRRSPRAPPLLARSAPRAPPVFA